MNSLEEEAELEMFSRKVVMHSKTEKIDVVIGDNPVGC